MRTWIILDFVIKDEIVKDQRIGNIMRIWIIINTKFYNKRWNSERWNNRRERNMMRIWMIWNFVIKDEIVSDVRAEGKGRAYKDNMNDMKVYNKKWNSERWKD